MYKDETSSVTNNELEGRLLMVRSLLRKSLVSFRVLVVYFANAYLLDSDFFGTKCQIRPSNNRCQNFNKILHRSISFDVTSVCSWFLMLQ